MGNVCRNAGRFLYDSILSVTYFATYNRVICMYQQLYRQTMTCVDKGWSQVFSETTAAADDVE